MEWALVGISPDRGVGISWLNQFIGNLWGVRSGRLIARDQVLSVVARRGLSDSTVNTYRDVGAPADRRLLTRHGRRDKYRTPINSPLPFRATWANVARGNWLQGRRAELLPPRVLPRSKPSRPMPEGSPSRRLSKRRGRGTKPKLGRARSSTQRSRPPRTRFVVSHPRAIRGGFLQVLDRFPPLPARGVAQTSRELGSGSRRLTRDETTFPGFPGSRVSGSSDTMPKIEGPIGPPLRGRAHPLRATRPASRSDARACRARQPP
jgi:hypothetical protein